MRKRAARGARWGARRAAFVGVLAILPACGNASGQAEGGEERFDAALPAAPASATDGGGGGSTFTDLYRDFFGPTGNANCSKESTCHGAADQAGAVSSGGFVCLPDQATCYDGMIKGGLIRPGSSGGLLVPVLRKTSGGGTMPKSPASRAFSPEEIDRIKTWIDAGAKND